MGSNINQDDICCLSISNLDFLGSHDRRGKASIRSYAYVNDPETNKVDVSQRYGKWKYFVIILYLSF